MAKGLAEGAEAALRITKRNQKISGILQMYLVI